MGTKAEIQEAVKGVIALQGNEYTAWRSSLRHVLTRRRRAINHGFIEGANEFYIFIQLFDMLNKQFGEEAGGSRFEAVLAGITKERQRNYISNYVAKRRANPLTLAQDRAAKKLYMRDYRANLRKEVAQGADAINVLPEEIV